MTPYELLTDIHALEEELLAFERKYGIRSEMECIGKMVFYRGGLAANRGLSL